MIQGVVSLAVAVIAVPVGTVAVATAERAATVAPEIVDDDDGGVVDSELRRYFGAIGDMAETGKDQYISL